MLGSILGWSHFRVNLFLALGVMLETLGHRPTSWADSVSIQSFYRRLTWRQKPATHVATLSPLGRRTPLRATVPIRRANANAVAAGSNKSGVTTPTTATTMRGPAKPGPSRTLSTGSSTVTTTRPTPNAIEIYSSHGIESFGQRHHSACVCLGGRDLVGPGSVPFRYAERPSSPMASHSQGNVGPPNIDSTTQTSFHLRSPSISSIG